jgi:nucleoside-diphosphate-sugar epimerase
MEIADRVIITGATGFVGRALAACLGRPFERLAFGAEDWRAGLEARDFRSAVVFHLAARVHHAGDADEAAFERDNVAKTRELALHAAGSGARRLVFLSSVKVHGEETHGEPFRREDVPNPQDAYARSKWAAEQALAAIAAQSGLEVVVVRSPLVYGAGAGGNLRALLRLADSPWPLPFASLANRRSFVHVGDLARLLVACAATPVAGGCTYLAANARSTPSTREIVASMRAAFGRPARLVAVPPGLLEATAGMIGERERVRRLTRSLEVDSAPTEAELGWRADVPIEIAVRQMVAAYRTGARA